MKKRVLSVVLAGILAAAALAGCGAADQGAAPAAAPAVEEAAEEAVEEVAEAAEEAAEEAVEEVAEAAEEVAEGWTGDVDEINVLLYDLRGVSENAGPIIDAMNEITAAKAGVVANVHWAGGGDYPTQVGLEIASGEQLDVCSIIPRDPASFTSMIGNSQLMDITEYLEEDGQETLELVGDYINGMSVNGAIYGVPCYRNYASGIYLIMRKDILEEAGVLDLAQNMTTWAEVEEVLAAVNDLGSISPIGQTKNVLMQTGNIYGGEAFADVTSFDALGDIMNIVFSDNDGVISLLPENPAFREQQDRVREWYNNGWVYKDSVITDDHIDTLIKAGVVFSAVETSEMGVEVSKQEATGYEVVCVELSKNLLSSSYINKFGLGVPVTAQEPEAAIRWINCLMTDPVLENLIIWGEEGKDYVIVDGEADFPEGVTTESVSYHGADFVFGNYFNAYPWKGNGADFRERAYDYLTSAPISPFLGFTCDQSDLNNVMTALTSVVDKYKGDILCGVYDDAEYDAYLSELKGAGSDEYLAAYQEQLDAWKAAQ
ncbi:MAG: ABC transporter substrate-binding protein [Lachnospiraceae bacterium]|nr:ABC transporter substrate-binding protein [Lachnospiraceae bacterium]